MNYFFPSFYSWEKCSDSKETLQAFQGAFDDVNTMTVSPVLLKFYVV